MSAGEKSVVLSPFRQRLVAEAARVREQRRGRAADCAVADAAGAAAGPDLEARVIARAMALPQASATIRAMRVQWTVFKLLAVGIFLLALVAGVVAARLSLGAGGAVNILWALLTLLGLQLLALLIWALATVLPASRGLPLGRGMASLSAWLGRRLAGGTGHGPVALALRTVMARTDLARGLFGVISHGLWLSYTLGALAASFVLLSLHQYDFYWATTILPEQLMVALLSGIGRVPGVLGFAVPDVDSIRFSRLGPDPFTARERWAGLLLGCLLVYGVLPRLLAAALSAWQARNAAAGYRLDLTQPAYARLATRLLPRAAHVPGVDKRPPPPLAAGIVDDARAAPQGRLVVDGTVGMLGLELDRAEADWPPAVPGLDWVVLGRADDRPARHDVLAVLRSLPRPLAGLVVIASLCRTPDRGTETYLSELQQTAACPILLWLDEGGRLAARGGDPVAREQAWRNLAARAGMESVAVLDIAAADHDALVVFRRQVFDA